MEVGKQTKLIFHGVDILNVNFDAFSPPQEALNIDVNCVPKVFYPIDNKNIFKIVMDIDLRDERYFELKVRAIGSFELDSELTEELRKNFVNSNAPAIMFPYIRSFISTLTANLGNVVGPVIIPTQFFRGDLEEYVE